MKKQACNAWRAGKATSNIEIDNLKKDAAKAYLARDDEKKRANSNRDKVEEKVRVVKDLEGQNETLTGQVNKFKNIMKTLQVRHPTCIPDHHLYMNPLPRITGQIPRDLLGHVQTQVWGETQPRGLGGRETVGPVSARKGILAVVMSTVST